MARTDLPLPCPECEPYGGLHRIVSRGGIEAADRCTCARGDALRLRSTRPAPVDHAAPAISEEEAMAAVEGLASMDFFPAEHIARAMIAEELQRLCRDARDLRALVSRFIVKYRKWPGPYELRVFFCSVIGPPLMGEDLATAESAYFPDGFTKPAEQLPAPKLALPPGAVASSDRLIDAGVQKTAKVLDMNRAIENAPKFESLDAKRRAEIEAMFEDARRQLREQKARGELGQSA